MNTTFRKLCVTFSALTTVIIVAFGLGVTALAQTTPKDQTGASSKSGPSSKSGKSGSKHAAAGSPDKGKEVFEKNCAMCHYADKTDVQFGPGLKDLFKNKQLSSTHKAVTAVNVREVVEKGVPQGKPTPMPAFAGKLSKVEIADLLAYLKTL